MGQSYKLAVGQSRRFSFHLRTALGHSLQVRPRPLVHKCPLCINTDRKFWALGFVAMCHDRTSAAAIDGELGRRKGEAGAFATTD